MSANLLLPAPSPRIFHRVSTASIARSHSRSWRSWRFPFPDPHRHRERSSPARRKETAKNAKNAKNSAGNRTTCTRAYPPLGSFIFGRRLRVRADLAGAGDTMRQSRTIKSRRTRMRPPDLGCTSQYISWHARHSPEAAPVIEDGTPISYRSLAADVVRCVHAIEAEYRQRPPHELIAVS